MCRKKSDRLEWMYSAPGHAGVNREEYLLGKSIDKAVDPLATNEEKVLSLLFINSMVLMSFISH